MLERRTFLMLMASLAAAGSSAVLAPVDAHARQGRGGDDNGGDDGDDDGKDDDSDDRKDDDDDREDDRKDDDRTEPGKGDQDSALDALRKGKIMPLEKALAIAGKRYPGRVIDVSLSRAKGRYVYGLKIRLDQSGRIKAVRLDAQSGKLLGLFGF